MVAEVYLIRGRPPSDYIHTSECRFAPGMEDMRWRWADENPTVDWKKEAPWLKACKRCNPPSPLRAAG